MAARLALEEPVSVLDGPMRMTLEDLHFMGVQKAHCRTDRGNEMTTQRGPAPAARQEKL